jgi:3-oxoacyl-[acyl-carrier-protein] synthase III
VRAISPPPTSARRDLAVQASQKLFAEHGVDPQSIDFVLLCTQTPDYPLPTTACLLQSRLGLKTSSARSTSTSAVRGSSMACRWPTA